jgi:hypothetical protein
VTEIPDEERRREELRQQAKKLGWESSELSDREIEDRLAETERRRDQLQEAWRRRHTLPAPEDRPDGRRKA